MSLHIDLSERTAAHDRTGDSEATCLSMYQRMGFPRVLNLRRLAIGPVAGDHEANLKPLEYLVSFAVAEGPIAGLFRRLANE